jgi:hypothetical protein
MGATLGDATFVEDQDLVAHCDGAETVGNHEHGAAAGQYLEGFLNVFLGLGVKGGGRFVQ